MEFQRVSERLRTEIVQRNHSMQTFNSYNASLRIFCKYFPDKKDSEHINSEQIYTHTSVGFKKRLPNPFDEVQKKPANVYPLRKTGT